ncbi:hypothetical protein C0971_03360 [Bacillus methanolicus]|nr:hypothetical protein C0971_03360 [Bacillus methanolicus]
MKVLFYNEKCLFLFVQKKFSNPLFFHLIFSFLPYNAKCRQANKKSGGEMSPSWLPRWANVLELASLKAKVICPRAVASRARQRFKGFMLFILQKRR